MKRRWRRPERGPRLLPAGAGRLMGLCLVWAGMAGAGALCACSGGSAGQQDSAKTDSAFTLSLADTLPEPVKRVARALAEGDAPGFASMVSYPLERPYPLHDIHDRKEMERYFPLLADDSLRRAAAGLTDASWQPAGWRGWMLGDGAFIWVDDSVYEIPYLSRAERIKLDSLSRREMESIPESMRRGWSPVACLKSPHSGAVYRIDRHSKARPGKAYRLSVWERGDSLSGSPAAVFTGRRQTEGSAGSTTYFFAAPSGATAVYAADLTDINERPRILFTDTDGETQTDTVATVYWLDLLSSPPAAKP